MASKNKAHILVTGPHRSGTTWLGRTLCVNPGVELVYEPFNPDFVRYNFAYAFDHWFEHVPLSPKKKEIENYFDRYLPQNGFQYAKKITRESGAGIKSPFIFAKKLMFQHQRPRYLLKDPIALMSAGWLYERYGLRVVCITRNPFAFAGSLKQQGWDFDFRNFLDQKKFAETYFPEDIAEMENMVRRSKFEERVALLWNVLNKMILYYRERYPEWYFTTHEKVAEHPLREFEKMYSYCGIPFTRNVASYIEQYTSAKNPGAVSSNVYQPRNARQTLHTWKKRLSPEEIACIKEITEFVYEKIYDTPVSELFE